MGGRKRPVVAKIFAWDYRNGPALVERVSPMNFEKDISSQEHLKFKYYRVRVRKGTPKSSRRIDPNCCKVPSNCGKEMKSALSRRSVSEIKCARVKPAFKVVHSNKILSDTTYIYFRVVMASKISMISKNSISTRFFSC